MVFAHISMQTTPRSMGSADRLHHWSCRRSVIANCLDDVANWMRSYRLQLNTTKTEILWSTTGRRSHLLPKSPLWVGTDEVMSSSVVRDLDIYIDFDVSMESHVAKTVCACFAALRQVRSIRRSVPRSILQSLVSSLFWPGWIMVTVHSSASRCTSLSDYKQWLTPPPGWCFPRRGMSTPPRSSASCTGSKHWSGSTTSSPFSFTSVFRV